MNRPIIILDAGHGGYDSGATGNGLKEKDLTLSFALALEPILQRHGFKVVLTRRTDKYLSLQERTNIANKYAKIGQPAFFFSIHINDFSNPNAHGIETFAYRGSLGSQQKSRVVHGEIIKDVKLYNRGTKTSGFYVLRKTAMQANLIEIGFISNKADMEYVQKNFNTIVNAQAKGICKAMGIRFTPKDVHINPPKPTPKPKNKNKDKVMIRLLSEYIEVDGFIKEGRNYITINEQHIELRALLEALELRVGWDNQNHIVTADKSKHTVLPKDNITIKLLDTYINVPTLFHKNAYHVKIGKSYISIRDIFETLGFKVAWDGKSKTIIVK